MKTLFSPIERLLEPGTSHRVELMRAGATEHFEIDRVALLSMVRNWPKHGVPIWNKDHNLPIGRLTDPEVVGDTLFATAELVKVPEGLYWTAAIRHEYSMSWASFTNEPLPTTDQPQEAAERNGWVRVSPVVIGRTESGELVYGPGQENKSESKP